MTVPHHNDNEDSSGALANHGIPLSSSGVESNDFFLGDYRHNREILDNLEADPTHDEVDEDRLIYAATKKFATINMDIQNRESFRARRPLVVSSSALRCDDSDSSGELICPDTAPQRTTRMAEMRMNFFRIFQQDNSYLEVSREEIRRVRAMHKRFAEGSEFSFNYNVLLIIASILAALGLGSDSVATIIASMLVSPLMGPVMGMAYSATIQDFTLFRTAFMTELVSLLACIAVGGLVTCCMIPFFDVPDEWPTPEMESRALMSSFWIGIPVAFFSGLGVAVSVLDEQTSSLVGVAISASLLPPAINAGMLWTTYFFNEAGTNEEIGDDAQHRFFREGVISLGLTLANIALIILSSMIMFRVKERVNIKRKKIFWTDLGLARCIYRNLAVYDNPADAPNPVRRMARRVSLYFHKGSTNRASNNEESSEISFRSNSSNYSSGFCTDVNVPQGSEDRRHKKNLSVVLEEKRSTSSSTSV